MRTFLTQNFSNVECESFDKLGQRPVWERASISFWESLGLPFIWARTKARDFFLLFKVKNIYIFEERKKGVKNEFIRFFRFFDSVTLSLCKFGQFRWLFSACASFGDHFASNKDRHRLGTHTFLTWIWFFWLFFLWKLQFYKLQRNSVIQQYKKGIFWKN